MLKKRAWLEWLALPKPTPRRVCVRRRPRATAGRERIRDLHRRPLPRRICDADAVLQNCAAEPVATRG
jgi:hypothetical protein